MTTIIVNHENNQIDEHDFASEINTITIGRRSTNDVCIPNLSVSGMHAKIAISENGAMIEDLGSTNGTYINGRLISRQLLNDGDDIVVGKTRVTFLQPSRHKAKASPNVVADEDLQDERPLTLAERAGIHKNELRSKPQVAADTPAQARARAATAQATSAHKETSVAGEHYSTTDQNVEFTAAVQPRATLNGREHTELVIPTGGLPTSTAAATQAQAASTARSKDAVLNDAAINGLNGFEQVEGEPDSSLTHSETTVHSNPQAENDMLPLGNDYESASAVIEIKNGAKSGQVLAIDKPVTTLGRPGIQIAAIMKKPEGYFLMHIESDDNIGPPQLNESSIGDEPVLLKSGDALNVAGIDVQFMQS